jgi:hypothetical protein
MDAYEDELRYFGSDEAEAIWLMAGKLLVACLASAFPMKCPSFQAFKLLHFSIVTRDLH